MDKKKFKGCDAFKKKINPTRVSIKKKESIRWLKNLEESNSLFREPDRCIHVGDRESDIYELFCKAKELGTHFLIRRCVNRLAREGKQTIEIIMKGEKKKGLYKFGFVNKKGIKTKASLEIKYKKILIFPPIGKQKLYPNLNLTILEAKEKQKPKGREQINWKLITDLDISSFQEAVEKIRWYSMRWKIETFHKILKSGCQIEKSKLRTAERLVKLISFFCIIGWRVFWLTMLNRCSPKIPAKLAFTNLEISLLNQTIKDGIEEKLNHKKFSRYLIKIAKLGGYLARKNDSPPGNTVIWRGISRLHDIEFGFLIGKKIMGN